MFEEGVLMLLQNACGVMVRAGDRAYADEGDVPVAVRIIADHMKVLALRIVVRAGHD